MQRKWKLILGLVLAVIVSGISIAQKNKGLAADLLAIESGTIADTFTEEGKVVPEVERPVYPVYGGKIIDLPVKEGQHVAKGDLLAAFDTTELEFQLKQLQAQWKSTAGEQARSYQEPYQARVKSQELQVEQAERDLQAAATNFDRSNALYQAGILTQAEFEEAQNAAAAARNNLEQQKQALSLLRESYNPAGGTKQYYAGLQEALEAQINLLEYQIAQSRITAPVDGTVAELSIKQGQVITPAAPVMTVFQEDAYQVEAFILAGDVSRIQTGMTVELLQDDKGEDVIFAGTVVKVAPSAVTKMSALGLEEERVKVTVKPAPPASLNLRPGYTLDVRFTTGQQENRLFVPKTALFPYENGEAVWVVENGKAAVRPVKTGFENDRDVVIEQGLDQGDLVILNPQLEGLQEGRKINQA